MERPAVRWRLCRSKDGKFYWVQVAENGETLSTSEMYTRRESADEGARAAGAPEDQLPLAPEDD